MRYAVAVPALGAIGVALEVLVAGEVAGEVVEQLAAGACERLWACALRDAAALGVQRGAAVVAAERG